MEVSQPLKDLIEAKEDKIVQVVLVYNNYEKTMAGLFKYTNFRLSSNIAEAGIAFGTISPSHILKLKNTEEIVSIELDNEQVSF